MLDFSKLIFSRELSPDFFATPMAPFRLRVGRKPKGRIPGPKRPAAWRFTDWAMI